MVTRISMLRFGREIKSEEFALALRSIEEAHHPLLISSANRAYFSALGVDPQDAQRFGGFRATGSRRFLEGDLVPAEDWREVVYVGMVEEFDPIEPGKGRVRLGQSRGPAKRFLEIGNISASGSSQLLKALCQPVALALNAKPESDETWTSLSWTNPGFDELLALSATFEPASFSPDQIAAAKTLKDTNLWKLAASVKASGGMLVKAFQKQFGSTEQDLSMLQTAGLVQKEHVVICKRTSGLVNRVPSRELLERLDEQGVRCGSCGRSLTDERLDELIAPTELGKQLLDHGRWMAALLIEELDRLGIPRDKVLLEFRESSEEVDAFIDIDGSLVMIELKDKEFSMGHAYPLSGRIAMYHPKHVLIVSRDKVAPDVRSYFERTKPEARLSYVEELSMLPQELETLINLARSSKVETLLEYFNPLTLGVDIPKLVASKLGVTLPKKEQKFQLGVPISTEYSNFFVANS
jgi:hypothetical protein